MKASERTLQQLLHSSDQYVIPVFQRYYTWGTANWEQLLADVSELLEVGADERRHFMGSIVTVPDGHQPGVVPAYQVIDGQQRLTTLSILLCVVRDVALSRGWNELAAEVEENYLLHRFKKGRERYKIFPRLRDRGGYLALVDQTDSTAGGQIEAAHHLFAKHVEQRAISEPELRRFFTALVTRLDFVAITLGAENPYKIFRSLNSTGVDLTEADLIRNHVFMSLPIDDQDGFDDTLWRDLESRFMREGKLYGRDIEAFLRDALMRDGTYVGRDETFEMFERKFPHGEFEPRTVVSDLVKLSKLYDVVRGATAHTNAEVETALRAIRELNVTTAYPLVTALLERSSRNELPRADLLVILRAIASFVLRRFVCGLSSRGYSTWFVAACRELGDPARTVLAFLCAKGWPSDDEFRAKFVRFNLYQSKYDRTVLAALELAVQAKSEQVLLDGCSIEHVMPQTIDDAEDEGRAWIAALGDPWRLVHAEWLHTPGNLTLVGSDYNREMSNRPFEIKRPVLAESKVYLNQHFKADTLKAWSKNQIEERANLLADLAINVWPAPLNQSS
ncbi:DUF262 domain-containing protein [Myxococcus sp. CA056]|uniref:DUF262 domain-containing protein n=1 Tax=Myxococcus sp. CA056 TaxID=2741740 RepID=UPI00157AA290|nr:DUF262 domain-containing protein [Myxococcus sp. CA056]